MSILLQIPTTELQPSAEVRVGTAVGSTTRNTTVKASTEASHDDETCPVIRANQVIFSAATSGRLRVLFF